jgi:hypothetical protein
MRSSVYGACDKLFACSRFPRDENRRIARCNFGDAREYTRQSRGGPDNLFKHRGLVDFLAQSGVFLLQFLLSPLAVFDIGTRNIPAHDLSLVVAHRIVASQKPTIASIMFAQPQLHVVTRAASQSTIPTSLCPFRVIRVNVSGRAPLPPLIKANAEVIEHHAIGVKTFAAGAEYRNKLGREITWESWQCWCQSAAR